MKVTFLGTGTSVGIPAIGCDCDVCQSDDPLNRRRRTSLYIDAGAECGVLIDTPPDFREQALEYNIRRIDAVLFTHTHADHIFGFDDIRRFNTMQGGVIPAYASPPAIADLRRVFDYIGTDPVPGVFRPRIEYRDVGDQSFSVGPMRFEALEVEHGNKVTHGFVARHAGRAIGYFPDCFKMSDAVVARLQGLDVMVLDGLRHRPHTTHLNVADSVALLQRIGAKTSYLTHLCHELDHQTTQEELPDGILVSYDGLVLSL